MKKTLINTFLLSVTAVLLIFGKLFIYGIEQGVGQLTIIYRSEPISKTLADQTFPDSLKRKIQLIQEIKSFTVDSLGFLPSENYEHIYHKLSDSLPIMVVLSACEPYLLKEKEWSFPILGKVPYKGYFNIKKAKQEKERLQKSNYDVSAYAPAGWSTLGWFKDPILSPMLFKSEGELSNLIIHELTHGTLFVKNDIDFNENLASFIGDKGTERFLAYKFGLQSDELKNYQNNKNDRKLFTNYMLESSKRLDSLFLSFTAATTTKEKEILKIKLINQVVNKVLELPLTHVNKYYEFALTAIEDKNAFFMAFTRYDSQYENFEKELNQKFNGNLSLYLNELKIKYPSL